MNNFEKRKFLDYLDKLLPVTSLTDYNFDGVFEFMLKEFKMNRKKYNFDESGCLDLDSRTKREEFIKIFKKDIKTLKEKIKPRNTLLEKQFNIIKDIYHLTKDEYEFVVYYALKDVNNIFRSYFDCIKSNEIANFAKEYLGIRVGKKDRILEGLYLKNITNNRRADEINEDFLKIFDNPECSTYEKIVSVIIGKPEKSNLKLEDYEHLKENSEKVIKILSCAVKEKKKGVNILLYGGVGTGKTEFAKLIANKANVPMFAVKTQHENFKEADREDRLVDLCSKQYLLSCLNKACILFDEGEDVMNRGFSDLGSASKGYLNNLLENTTVPIIWTTNDIYGVDPAFLRRMTYCIEFEKLTEQTRLKIWKRALKKNNIKINKAKLEELNRTYEVAPSIITNAIETTKIIGGNESDFENLIENVAQVVNKRKNITKTDNFKKKDYDINLVNTDLDMDNLTEKIKKAGKLNFSLCLYGEPGTGKSEYARYLADRIGVDVVLKKASDLMCMWVGETEKNIARAFAEAKSKKAMLIIDEADSFLQNRNNAHRSWEISLVNEMLTWMESHQYPFVCTTNLINSLDEASLRRFTFKVKFDFLKPEQVSSAIEHFFGIKNANVNIKGLTAGDFATVKKKIDFLGTTDIDEITKMLMDEVKVKKSPELQNAVGF